ncbi:MAG TPA: ABC transporter permease [Oceanobacillus sp.]|nr:ABC transporter permease [Oceanobacillus sp.]
MTTTVAKLNVPRQEHRVGESLTTLALRRLRRDKLTLLAMFILFVLALLSFTAPITTNWLGVSYTRTNAAETFLPIGAPGHILGTDDLGRDHLARLLYAGQVSLSVGFFAAVLSMTIGVTLGIVTGYFGGFIDDVVNWLIATLTSIPSLFLLLIVSAVLLNSSSSPTVTLVLVLGFLGWTTTTRLVRGETLSIREREYVISARAIGASSLRIMFVHILPNLFSVIVVTMAIDIGSLILAEAGLSFLGLGIKPPTPSWGNMLTGARSFFNTGPHLVIFPGLLIFLSVLCLYIIGDGVRDAFDPTAKD